MISDDDLTIDLFDDDDADDKEDVEQETNAVVLAVEGDDAYAFNPGLCYKKWSSRRRKGCCGSFQLFSQRAATAETVDALMDKRQQGHATPNATCTVCYYTGEV
jgi:hypothetical protein